MCVKDAMHLGPKSAFSEGGLFNAQIRGGGEVITGTYTVDA
jgi:hypothetical protein